MAKLTDDQGMRLEEEIISIFQSNPNVPYQEALTAIKQRHPDLEQLVVMNDLNYRITKLRRTGKIPASNRGGRGRATQVSPAATATHPVARAYQELDDAKRAVEEAQRRYVEAQVNLRMILKESLPQDFLETLVQDMNG